MHSERFEQGERIEVGTGADAVLALEHAVASDPWPEEPRLRLAGLLLEQGRLLVEAGRSGDALPSLARAAELAPLDADIAFFHGNALYAAARKDEAAAAYRRALAIIPDFPAASFNLGIALGRLGGLEEASASFARAVRLDPRHADARRNLAVTLFLLGRPADEAGEPDGDAPPSPQAARG